MSLAFLVNGFYFVMEYHGVRKLYIGGAIISHDCIATGSCFDLRVGIDRVYGLVLVVNWTEPNGPDDYCGV
ncbi:hypothetical protein VTL71DRAFT_709 [Oculimacula yallundae]|uniref:Uncharacterized protein n=1 Tax=Oculimacula yallundae TaxID=86028 RepID=A0ABR4D347_9HELO